MLFYTCYGRGLGIFGLPFFPPYLICTISINYKIKIHIVSILLLPITNVLSGVYKGEHILVFGFAHKNSFYIILFNLIIMWFWLNYVKVSRKKVSYIVILGCILFYLANTRTAIAILLVFYILFVKASKHGYSKVLEIVSMGIFPALSFMWYAAIKHYTIGYNLLRKANSILSDRLVMAAYYYNEVGFSSCVI